MRITAFCGSSRRSPESYLEVARTVGAEIARRGHVLVYGGGRTGLMGALADASLAEGGRVEGVTLRAFREGDVHHGGLSELTVVECVHECKGRLAERADAFLALPGGLGTLEELADTLSARRLGLHDRPIVLLDGDGFFAPFLAQLERAIEADFEKPAIRELLQLCGDPRRAVALCEGGEGERSVNAP